VSRSCFDELVAAVAAQLDRSGVPVRVIGAAALACHGVTRGTRDLDLLVTDPAIDGWDIEALLAVAADRPSLVAEVEGSVTALPKRCVRFWRRILAAYASEYEG
jgi:hypothetical protein